MRILIIFPDWTSNSRHSASTSSEYAPTVYVSVVDSILHFGSMSFNEKHNIAQSFSGHIFTFFWTSSTALLKSHNTKGVIYLVPTHGPSWYLNFTVSFTMNTSIQPATINGFPKIATNVL